MWWGCLYYFKLLNRVPYNLLDTSLDPCVEDSNYSFTTCVKESRSRKIGCPGTPSVTRARVHNAEAVSEICSRL